MINLGYRGRHHHIGVAGRVFRAVAARFLPAERFHPVPMRAEPVWPPLSPTAVGGCDLASAPAAVERHAGRTGQRPAGGDQGAFTVEFAAALPAMMMLLSVGLTTVTAASDRGRCYDAARDAALAAARGGSGLEAGAAAAPPGASIELHDEGGQVRAVVSVPVRTFGFDLPQLRATGTAVAAVEPGVTVVTE
ncbi:TadE family type IV pilus minor pilin [Catenuloplanes sp. NPDC051500]|uniref:TadE family type IV pilus minor pilin n=1 Tax=Catenuloplanes sp. NPDC051500 TaxID=3363959 RepID=UPI0037B813F8